MPVASFPGFHPDFITQPWRKNLGGGLGTRLVAMYVGLVSMTLGPRRRRARTLAVSSFVPLRSLAPAS